MKCINKLSCPNNFKEMYCTIWVLCGCEHKSILDDRKKVINGVSRNILHRQAGEYSRAGRRENFGVNCALQMRACKQSHSESLTIYVCRVYLEIQNKSRSWQLRIQFPEWGPRPIRHWYDHYETIAGRTTIAQFGIAQPVYL